MGGGVSRNGQVRASRREKDGGGKAPPRDLNPAFLIRGGGTGPSQQPTWDPRAGIQILSLPHGPHPRVGHSPGWVALWMATDAMWGGARWKREVGPIILFSPRTGPCSTQNTPWEAAPTHSCFTPKKGLEKGFHHTFALARQARYGKAVCPLDRKSAPGDILSIERGTRDRLP